ncbi:MAG TPA: hypothetical protein VD794_06530 [Flavisolibacter sp.]|nr:hypothetical protein [Flavisolibacter sp.]
MKKILTFLLSVSFWQLAFATEQVPDKLLYNNLSLTVNTGWGHPSPLQTYFYQNRIAYPFSMLSTANYRGHVATWLIDNDKLYLKEITIKDKSYTADKFEIKSKSKGEDKSDNVFADWFSGVIEGYKTDGKDRWKVISTYYFQIRNGKIISMSEVTEKDFNKISKLSQRDSANKELMLKYRLLLFNQNYITYYYRLNESDAIIYQGKTCKLNTGTSRLSPIYALYSNQHLNWPFNWENLEKSGAPNCNWEISNDSLLLTSVNLYSGLRFDSIDKERIALRELIPGQTKEDNVFADWVTGVQLIVYGIDTTYGYGLKEFKAKEYTYCRFEKGILKEAYSIPSDFDMKKNEDSLDPRLKVLIKEYN